MDITIYSTTTCSFCHVLTKWLDSQNIGYTKKNTDEDEDALVEFMSVNDGQLSVPFTVVQDARGNRTKIPGFDKPKFQEVLGL